MFDSESQRAGLRIAELPVEVAETRRSSWGLLNRIPRTLVDLTILRALPGGKDGSVRDTGTVPGLFGGIVALFRETGA